jgi:hypothetical protein
VGQPRRLGPVLGLALAPAAVIIMLTTSGVRGAEAAPTLTGEVLVLDPEPQLVACTPGATSYAFSLTGAASGPLDGTYTATVTTTVADGHQVTTIAFDVADGAASGTQTFTSRADGRSACAGPADGQVSTWSGHVAGLPESGTSILSAGARPGQLLDTLTGTPSETPSSTPTPSGAASPSAGPSSPPSASGDPSVPPTDAPSVAPSETPAPVDDSALAFRYDVASAPGAGDPSGSCTVTGGDGGHRVEIICLDVARYRQSGHRVTFSGRATQNGESTPYTIRVVDGVGGRPDSFRIETGAGYLGGGDVTTGGLTVH